MRWSDSLAPDLKDENMSANQALEPLRVFENREGAQFIVYNTDKGAQVELRFEDEEPWVTQAQMAQIFGVDLRTANEHVQNFLKDGELDDSVIRKFRITAADGKSYNTLHYGLDAVLYVGFRVNSNEGKLFRRWNAKVLRQYLLKGFVIDKERLKHPDDYGRVQELRRIIAEIRASDINMYGELKSICKFAKDYDPKSEEWQDFYAHMRAKLYWAVTSKTPSMIIAERADATAPNMGLQSWRGDEIIQKDATSAPSYLTETEFRELNNVTVILLDVFSDQADLGRLTSMKEAEKLFDDQLKLLRRPVLTHGGNVSSKQAEEIGKAEYKRFNAARREARLRHETNAYLELKATTKALPKPKTKKTAKKDQGS
jgi:hypothetical protein